MIVSKSVCGFLCCLCVFGLFGISMCFFWGMFEMCLGVVFL